jgi:6-phosphofructokinase 1
MKMDEVIARLQKSLESGKKHSIILVAEGVGSAVEIAKQLKQQGMDTRLTVLGHVQRGGSPTAFDRVLASRMGAKAVECLLKGESHRMIAIRHNEVISVDFAEAIKQKHQPIMSLFDLSKILSI